MRRREGQRSAILPKPGRKRAWTESTAIASLRRVCSPPLRNSLRPMARNRPRAIPKAWRTASATANFRSATSTNRFPELDGLAGRRSKQFTLPHHAHAAHEGAHRPAADGHAVVRSPSGARGDPSVGDRLAALDIDDGQIGIIADGKAPFPRDAEQAGRSGARQIDQTLQRETTRVDVV